MIRKIILVKADVFYDSVFQISNYVEGDDAGSFEQADIQGGKRAVSKAFNSGYEYGDSYILFRQDRFVVLLYMDWDNFKDANVGYDYLPEEILQGFGF